MRSLEFKCWLTNRSLVDIVNPNQTDEVLKTIRVSVSVDGKGIECDDDNVEIPFLETIVS